MRIASKISLIFVLVFLSILLVAGGIVMNSTLGIIKNDVFDELYYNGQAMVLHVQTYINDQKKTGEVLAEASVYRDFLKQDVNSTQYSIIKEKINERLERTIKVDGNIIEIFILNKDGKIVASTEKSHLAMDKASDVYFLNAKNQIYIKDIYFSNTIKKNGYTISVPILDEANNRFLGVSVVRYSTKGIESILNGYGRQNKSKEAFLINNNRYFLTQTRFTSESVVLKQVVDTQNAKDCFDPTEVEYITRNGYIGLDESVGKRQRVESTDYRGIPVLATHNYIPETKWCLITKIDQSEFLSSSNTISRIFMLVFVLSLVFVILISYMLARQIIKPIEKLILGAGIIAGGNYDYIVDIKSKDEVGDLAFEFDKMSMAIKQSRLEINQKVNDQTEEIVTKNEDMGKQQRAIINILEDVELAKGDLEKFKLAVENASDHIVITDAEGIVLYANKAVERITGFNNSEVVGKKAGNDELWGGLMEKSFYKKMWKTIKIDKKIFSGEINNKKKNGDKYISFSSISPVIGKNGEVVFFVGVERDITHEKEVDRMKTDFISLASHQLRTPLSAMRWFSEMLLAGDAGKLSKDQTEFVKNIESANARMIVLVNSLLNISRIESGRIVVDPEPTDLKQLVDDQLLEIDKQLKDKKQTAVVSVNKNMPKINVDPKLIREVYKNLLTNASKYTQDGGQIEIFISSKDKEIISQVSDNGLGIPTASQEHIFERFFRAENVVKTETEGTGLGLYLAKAIVESSGGKMWFKSEIGKGTSFWFSLPLKGVKKKAGEITINS